jgi:hypothetical protein
MTDIARLRSLLERLEVPATRSVEGGLSSTSIDIYLLVLLGSVRTVDLDKRYGRERVEIGRRQLSQWGLVLDRKTPKGRTLFAIPPLQAWSARAADFVWTIEPNPRPLHALQETGLPAVDAAHSLCREISEAADRVFIPENNQLALEHSTALKSAEQIAVALSQLINVADETVRAMSIGPRLPHVATIWEAIERRLVESDFQYQRLVAVDEIIEHGLAIVRRDVLQTGVQLFVAGPDVVDSTYYLCDKRAMLTHDSYDNGSVTTNRRLINSAVDKFNGVLGKAQDALSVVSVLQRQANQLRDRSSALVSPDAQWLLDRKIANGKFARRKADWDEARYESVQAALIDQGLLVKTRSYVLPAYDEAATDVIDLDGDRELDVHAAPCLLCWCPEFMCVC